MICQGRDIKIDFFLNIEILSVDFVNVLVDKYVLSLVKDIRGYFKSLYWQMLLMLNCYCYLYFYRIEYIINGVYILVRMCYKMKFIFLLKNKKRIYLCFLLLRIVIEDFF